MTPLTDVQRKEKHLRCRLSLIDTLRIISQDENIASCNCLHVGQHRLMLHNDILRKILDEERNATLTQIQNL